MITCDYNILIYRCLMINIEKLQTVMIDPAQLLVQWLLWILWIDDYIWLPLSIYPPVVTNIDVLFIHHICRSFSEWETMVSPWFLHLFFLYLPSTNPTITGQCHRDSAHPTRPWGPAPIFDIDFFDQAKAWRGEAQLGWNKLGFYF